MIGLGQGMTCLPDESQVLYRSKDGKNEKTFDELEWLAAMCSHVPNKGEQMVRYYGYYSNVSRGKRKKQEQDEWIPCILEPDKNSKEYRKNWARLIQKIYKVDPLTCPKCSGKMKIISVIEDQEVVKKILKHLGLPRRTSSPEPRNRDAAWRVISALFRSKRRLSVNLGLAPPCVHSGPYQPGTPSSAAIILPST